MVVRPCVLIAWVRASQVLPGALITFIQKGLEYVSIEEHLEDVRP
jgi:hypothetical protein